MVLLDDFMAWPYKVVDALYDACQRGVGGMTESSLNQAVSWLRGQIQMSSCYSGYDAPALALHWVCTALERRGLLPAATPARPHVVMGEACDIKRTAQEILCCTAEPYRPRHVFCDINDFVPRKVQDVLNNIQGAKRETLDDKVGAWFEMKDVMQSMGDRAFTLRRHAPCAIAGHTQCSTFQADVNDHVRGLPHIHTAGTTCKDESTMNKNRMSIAGDSGRPLLIWMYRRRVIQEDCILTECTPTFKHEIFEEVLGDLYELKWFMISPSQLGWWVSRRRKFCVLRLKTGKFASIGDSAMFEAIFFRTRTPSWVKADMFFTSGSAGQEEMAWRFASVGGIELTGPTTNVFEVLPGSIGVRKTIYQKQFIQKQLGMSMEDLDTLPASDLESLIAHMDSSVRCVVDLHQAPNWGTIKTNGEAPCLLSHNLFYSLRYNHVMTGRETFLLQGVDLSFDSAFPVPWGNTLDFMTDREHRDLSGNSINCHVVGALLMFILATATPVAGHDIRGENAPYFGTPEEASGVSAADLKRPRLT